MAYGLRFNLVISSDTTSGFSWLSSFFNSVGNFFKSIFNASVLRSIAQIALTYVLSLTPLGPILAAAASAAIITGLSGGNLGQMLKAGVFAAITAGAFQGLNEFVGGLGPQGISQSGQYLANVAGSAMIGCLSAAASGGSCKSGALAAGVTAAASPLVGRIPGGPGRLAASSLVGGLASVAGGGKFENGAVTGAFQYMFGPRQRDSEASTDARMQAMAFDPAAAEAADADMLREALAENRTATMVSGGIGLAGIAAAAGLGTLGVVAGDHIVLGIADYSLGDVAASVGGRTLLSDPNWRFTLMEALGNASTRFTVSLDGFAGAGTFEQVMGAAMRGLGSAARATEWEIGQLYQAGRLGSTTFVRGGRVVANPF